ncbi:parB-like nuclease [Acetobacter aceti NRIC 0242]|uniref:ParB-like N-terminal domain-containing protein n=1 Tax=Acetobacter aceti NBRC 14818 TaxID=887700 RepID=A0AB33IH02_ACEAC|nr:ParB N-terminal domain-containing protein [Acetobacter aceti]TCS31778.1 ParB family chromosome partitioning protein [Acetobacter aceti NBRC 14818]BCK77197.1 hypothetical protein EMQ_2803 [Acetobacter aceti NBRC 14818]GAN58325.1 chromosome partitioning nuclease protein ParB [Acetobacter aceti NBRC 14818]GBO80665.1 parB-like nuclease [Acetobacter aceti NRIC 0242]
MNVKKIALADIDPRTNDRIRPVNEGYVEIIAQSFIERGQDTPIEVRYGTGAEGSPKYILVAGGHRLAAAHLAGWNEVSASVSKLNADQARLKEIDENLIRQELDILSRARSLFERKELYLRLYPETRNGGDRVSDQFATVANCLPRFAVDAAARMGVSERTVHGYVSLYRNLQPETVRALQGTTLANDRSELLFIGSIKEPGLQVERVKKALAEDKKPSELASENVAPVANEEKWLVLGRKEAARVLKMEAPARRVFLDELVTAGLITRDQILEAA